MDKLQLREGGIYRRRDGQIVGPATKNKNSLYRWKVHGRSYKDNGRFCSEPSWSMNDLIEEVFLGQPITDEEVVRRFNKLVRDGKILYHAGAAFEPYLPYSKTSDFKLNPKTIHIFDREVTQEELRALKKALEECDE